MRTPSERAWEIVANFKSGKFTDEEMHEIVLDALTVYTAIQAAIARGQERLEAAISPHTPNGDGMPPGVIKR